VRQCCLLTLGPSATDDTSVDSPVAAGETARRTFLAQIIGACLAFLAALLGIPAIGAAVGPALKREEAEWLSLGSPDAFQEGVPKAVNLTVVSRDGWIETTVIKGVWVVRQPGGQYTVFNGRCTHLGCAYSWQTDQHQFACPCHAGIFGIDSNVLAGPPPRPLDTLPTRVEGGDLEVQYTDFHLGTPDKVPS
jgi:menaquinol-cytochrome c reductase iron-sulfur subunit